MGDHHGDPGKLLLIMTVEIGDGRSDQVRVHANSDYNDLAKAFCARNGIDSSVAGPLAHHIAENIAGLKRNSSSSSGNNNNNNKSSSGNNSGKPKESGGTSGRQTDKRAGLSVSADMGRPPRAVSRGRGRNDESAEQPARPRTASERRDPAKSKSKSSQKRSVSTSFERLATEYPKLKAERLERLRAQHTQKLQQDLTLHPRIDPHSAELAASRSAASGGNGEAVFNRLHEDSVRRAKHLDEESETLAAAREREVERSRIGMSQMSRELMKNRTSGPYDNYGERLYKEGQQAAEKKQKELERRREEVEKLELSQATFHPKISALAQQKKRNGDFGKDIKDTLGQVRDMEREKLRQELLAREMKECTFHPSISDTSRRIVDRMRSMNEYNTEGDLYSARSSSLAVPRYESLYRDAEQRRLRLADYENWINEAYTFKPDIGMNHHYPPTDANKEDFINRMVYCKQKKQEVMNALRDKALRDGIDPETNEVLFRPKTGRPPVIDRREKRFSNVNEALYNDFEALQRKHQELVEKKAAEQELLAEHSKVLKKSQTILEMTLRKRLEQIFEVLDEDHDGYIETETVSGKNLDTEIAKDILPIVHLHFSGQKFINKTHFVSTVFKVLQTSQTGPKPYFFSSRVKGGAAHEDPAEHYDPEHAHHAESEELRFRPEINPRSKELAEKRRPSGVPIHELLLKEGEQALAHKQILYEKRIEEGMMECTFRPHLDTSRSGSAEPVVIDSAKAEELARRLSQKSTRNSFGAHGAASQHKMTSLEMEVLEHCTFRPNTQKTKESLRRHSITPNTSTAHNTSRARSASPAPRAGAGSKAPSSASKAPVTARR